MSQMFEAFACSIIILFLHGTSAFADCRGSIAGLDTALAAADLAKGEAAIASIDKARDCAPADVRASKRKLVAALLAAANTATQAGKRHDADHFVEEAASYRSYWNASMEMGDISLKTQNFAEAARSYQDAIGLLQDDFDDNGSVDAPKATLTSLTERADEARHLAAAGGPAALPMLVTAAPDRDGHIGGIYSAVVNRGIEAAKVPVPILFEFNSDAFTPVGQQAAEEIAALLKQRVPASLTVIGHTDRIGGEQFNRTLSLRRAQHVAAFLRQEDVKSTITVVGKGKTEPRVLADPTLYSQAQIDELNRRVEFDWGP